MVAWRTVCNFYLRSNRTQVPYSSDQRNTASGAREEQKIWSGIAAVRQLVMKIIYLKMAFRLRQSQYLSANTIPIREQVKDSVEFVRLVWEEIERSLREEEP